MKIGVYVGSFNPVHKGHMKIVEYLLDRKVVDKVLIVPTLGYWDKQNLVDLNHRINMLKIFEKENIKIDTTHNKCTYTCEIMEKLSEETNDEYYLILGADNIVQFGKWEYNERLSPYKIIVMNRNKIDINSYIENYEMWDCIVLNDFDCINVSSSEIRKDLNNKYLDKRVFDYIYANNLYHGI